MGDGVRHRARVHRVRGHRLDGDDDRDLHQVRGHPPRPGIRQRTQLRHSGRPIQSLHFTISKCTIVNIQERRR